ncbi:MAG: hypothetical protein Q7S40_32390 [Opitutaceae bacterium]|nr:hypothetical protein [Opitutaceae bacterium]
MNDSLQLLAVRIREEVVDVARVLERIEEGWRRAARTADDYYLDSVALNLHALYTGLERIFERIANRIDGGVPQGEDWHRKLLLQMTREVTGVRPAVISDASRKGLEDYRGFRHVARNIYTFNLDPAKVERLALGARGCFIQVQAEVLAFADFMAAAALRPEIREAGEDEMGKGDPSSPT